MEQTKQHILVPSFKPPKSSSLFQFSFAQKTAQLLQLKDCKKYPHEVNNNRNHQSLQIKDTLSTILERSDTREEKISARQLSSTPLAVYEGKMTYNMQPNKNEKRPSPQLTSGFEKEKKRPKHLSLIAPSLSNSAGIWGDKRPKITTTVALSRTSKSASAPSTNAVNIKNVFSLSVEGIERFCRNVGASAEALDAFESLCNASNAFSIALVFLDGTTTHVQTCVKLCVPSKPCHHWYCTCDRHIRARQGISPLMGVAFCIQGQEEYLYFLSLTSDLDTHINCSSSLEQRWDKLFDILCTSTEASTAEIKNVPHKVMFNVQIGLMPLLYKLKHSKQQFVDMLSTNNNKMFDIKIASHLCDSNLSEEDLEFQSISDRCIACTTTNEKNAAVNTIGSGSVTKVLYKLHGELKCLLQMRVFLEADLGKKQMLDCFFKIEMPIAKQLACMELRGIRVISASKLNTMRTMLRNFVSDLEEKAVQMLSGLNYPKPFNLSSPEQVAYILFTVLKLGAVMSTAPSAISIDKTKTKAGKHQSTSEEDLVRIQEQHPIVKVILAHRHVSKVLHTFVEGLIPFIADDSASPLLPSAAALSPPAPSFERRVYASWNQTSTRTGRFSCQKPNLQAFPNPKRLHSLLDGAVDTNVRAIFTASNGGVLISADYSQIEMRVLAHMCGDSAMISLFNRSEGDIYETLARIILNKKEREDVSSVERERAKVICLGTMYGMGLPAAAGKLQIPLQLAQNILNSFYLKFKNVKRWIQFIKSDAKQKGYVATISGRKRFLPDITSSDTKKRSQAERQAVNSVIQGSASDVIKYAMLSVEKAIDQHAVFGIAHKGGGDKGSVQGRAPLNLVRPTIISQIHDEVIYDLPLQHTHTAGTSIAGDLHVQQFVYLLRDCLENVTRLGLGIKVPLLVKVAMGDTWGNMSSCNMIGTEPPPSSLHLPSPYRVVQRQSSPPLSASNEANDTDVPPPHNIETRHSPPLISQMMDGRSQPLYALQSLVSSFPDLAEKCHEEDESVVGDEGLDKRRRGRNRDRDMDSFPSAAQDFQQHAQRQSQIYSSSAILSSTAEVLSPTPLWSQPSLALACLSSSSIYSPKHPLLPNPHIPPLPTPSQHQFESGTSRYDDGGGGESGWRRRSID